jgi:hypothetical protein
MLARIGVAVLAVVLTGGVMFAVSSQPSLPTPNFAIDRDVAIVTGQPTFNGRFVTRQPHEQMISGGVLESVLRAREARAGAAVSLTRGAALSAAADSVQIRTVGCSMVFPGAFDNIRVNQDCNFRVHAEQIIVVDPLDPDHLVAAQNSREIGVNHCSISYSFDRGRHWGYVGTPPLWEFIALDGHKFDHASDPALAMDSRGNTYFTCVIFDDLAAPGGILVTKSNAEFGGSFFHTPKPSPTQRFRTLPLGVVTNTNTPTLFHDKEFIFADANPASPKRDNVYVTWTEFRMDATGNVTLESPIFFSQSTDGGVTWSPSGGVEISGASSACVLGNFFDPSLPPNKCNFDQGSWLVTGPDGTLYVFFNNSNTPTIVAQQMMVKCPAAADCSKKASWSEPVSIADDFDTQPFGPDPISGCNGGRQCLPPNGYRLNDFGNGALDPNTGRLYFAWADFRNGGTCATRGGLPVPPCTNYNNDVFLVTSDDGGSTWSTPTLVSGGSGTKAAQWQPWLAVAPDGTVYVAYYDRGFGTCESTGCNDITLATSHNHGATFQHTRITTQSMPNLTAVTTPTESGFLGDYMSVVANNAGAYVLWADTRPHAGTTPEESIFFSFVPAGSSMEANEEEHR